MSHASERFRHLLAAGGLAGSLILLLLVSSEGTNAQWIPGTPQFAPTIDFKLCNDLPADFDGPDELKGAGGTCVENSSQGADPDLSFDFNIPAGHLNFSLDTYVLLINLSSDFNMAADADIPDGTVVGGSSNTIRLGWDSNPCNWTTDLDFIWYDSTTDTSNVFVVPPETTPGRFDSLASDGGEAFDDKADSNSPVVTQYPDITNKFFDPDGSGQAGDPYDPVQPYARYAGLSKTPELNWQLLQILVFEPGVLRSAFSVNPDNSTHPFTSLDSSLGWTITYVLRDPTQAATIPDAVSNFCSPLHSTSVLLGRVDSDGDTVADTARLTNPSSVGGIDGQGTQLAALRIVSDRDADSDGIENDFDTCPFTTNIDDPYVTSGADTDMLDPACDPNSGMKVDDQDDDFFLNSQDTCPRTSNPSPQIDSEKNEPYNIAAPDGGPPGDYIGDACDPNPAVADGLFFFASITDAFCINDDPLADEDNDGWCSLNPGADPDDNDALVTGEPNLDDDGDGFQNVREIFMQTDPRFDCPQVVGSHDAWPPDINLDRRAALGDVLRYIGKINTEPPGPPYDPRYDLTTDDRISLADVLKYIGVMNETCTP